MSMFSKNLSDALSKRGIKQVDFANVLKVPPTTVSGWIRGAHEPSIDMLLTVCSYLNIPIGEMVGDKNYYVKGCRVTELDSLRCRVAELKELLEKREIELSELRKLKSENRDTDSFSSFIKSVRACEVVIKI